MPYWADLWPAARMLAKAILREPWPEGPLPALEIGCGLGLPGIAALSRGLRVTFSDYDATALHFAARNARRNGFDDFETLRLDWRRPPESLQVPVVLASDLLYELRNVEPLVGLIQKVLLPDGVCLLTDQDRVPSHLLRETLAAEGLPFTTQVMHAGEPGGRRVRGTLYRIRRGASPLVASVLGRAGLAGVRGAFAAEESPSPATQLSPDYRTRGNRSLPPRPDGYHEPQRTRRPSAPVP